MNKFIKYSGIILCGASLLVAAGCSGDMNLGEDQILAKGGISIDFNISGSPLTKGSAAPDGDLEYNENSISEIDLFFYTESAGENDPSVYHYHDGNGEVRTVSISFDDLPESIKGDMGFKIYAVLNLKSVLGATSSAPENQKSLAVLKALTTYVEAIGTENSNHRSFKAPDAPKAFVMTNFSQADKSNYGKVDVENGTKVTIALKRVASKIRVALAVDEEVTDDEGTWKPDFSNMRLYMSNGVRKARLDGDVRQLTLADDAENPANSDYFNIVTSGNKMNDDSDYKYARPIIKHESGNKLTGETDYTYICYNEMPHYTYPTTWNESFTETHQPMLTIVIPWRIKENGNNTYQPTYYSIPVNSKGEIVSNAYYYIRTHIGMKGSITPEAPMPVDVESKILDWGTADQTDVELKPIRYLILNQKEFTINNKTEWTVPFNSTHPCSIVDCKIWVYGYNGDYGYETGVVIDDKSTYGAGSSSTKKAKGILYDYSVNNSDNTFTFTHHLFEDKFYIQRENNYNLFNVSLGNNGAPNSYNEKITDSKGRTYIRKVHVVESTKKTYSRYDVELTLRHTDKLDDDTTPYQETVLLHFFPNIFITSDKIDDGGGLNSHDGWILVNGYGTSDTNTGDLKVVSAHQGDGSDSRALLTLTVTTLDEEDKKNWGWIIDDPRTMYINNDLSDASMLKDEADNTTRWVNSHGGPYDGTRYGYGDKTSGNRHDKGSGLKTMWEYNPYNDLDWTIAWSGGTWDVLKDYYSDEQYLEDGETPNPQYHRTLSYYYPAHEVQEKAKIIAPKFTVVSIHAYAAAGSTSKATARRRCAAYQQWGYPAGRWRLPTHAEIQFLKKLQSTSVILDVFVGTNHSAQGAVNSRGVLDPSDNTAMTRCVYDNWYWEQVDANGTSYNRIPDPDGTHANWKKFHWGDRPKENPLSDNSADAPTVENFIRKATTNR